MFIKADLSELITKSNCLKILNVYFKNALTFQYGKITTKSSAYYLYHVFTKFLVINFITVSK